MMRIKTQAGFAALELVLIIVILGLIAGTGYYVWHSKQNTDKTLNQANNESNASLKVSKLGKDCTISTPAMQGKLFVAGDGTYEFCMPNGWELNGSGTLAQSDFFSSNTNPTYNESLAAKLVPGGGSDGVSPLFISKDNLPLSSVLTVNEYHKVGAIQSVNANGVEYEGKQTVQPEGLGAANFGAVEHLYYFENGAKHIAFNYTVDSGQADNAAQVKAVAQTLKVIHRLN